MGDGKSSYDMLRVMLVIRQDQGKRKYLTTALLLERDGVEKKANKYFNGNAMICL